MKKTLSLFFLLMTLALSNQGAADTATFRSAFVKGDFHQALLLWPSSPEARNLTPTHRALFGYALYRDNMPLLGFNELAAINDLNSVSGEVKSLWRSELGINSSFWRTANISWQKKFSGIFPEKIATVIAAWSLYDLTSDNDMKKAQGFLRELEGTDAGNWVKWQLALGYGLKGRTALAVDYLQSLIDSGQTVVGQDDVLMSAARMLYQDNKLDLATKYYDKISKSSDYWLEALEERAWIFARVNNFERTLGEMKTILSPPFAPQVGPESYFLATLADLRVCDYAAIFDVLKNFKTRNQTRLIEIQKLADTGHNKTSDLEIARLEKGVSSWAELGPDLDKVPRFVNRDEILNRDVTRQRMGHIQKEELTTLASQNSYYSTLVPEVNQTSQKLEKAAPQRLQVLAQRDIKEFKTNLLKLQLVDAEAVHRMHVGQNYAQKVQGGGLPKVKDAIEFPYEDNEIWLDEVDHYQASTKGCPVNPKKAQTL